MLGDATCRAIAGRQRGPLAWLARSLVRAWAGLGWGLALGLALGLGLCIAGCNSTNRERAWTGPSTQPLTGLEGPGVFALAQSQEQAAFEVAVQVLRELRFTPERIDARQGIITTAAKRTGGLASLWDAEQSSLSQEIEDTLHMQTRSIRITFTRASVPTDLQGPSRELFMREAPITCDVEAFVYRTQTPNMRPQPRVLGLTSQTIDPALTPRGMQGQFIVALSRDDRLAAWLARRIESRLVARASAR